MVEDSVAISASDGNSLAARTLCPRSEFNAIEMAISKEESQSESQRIVAFRTLNLSGATVPSGLNQVFPEQP